MTYPMSPKPRLNPMHKRMLWEVQARYPATPPTEARQAVPASYHDYLADTRPPAWKTDPDHIRLIAQNLDRLEKREIDRLAIFMPPRHGKSETVTYRLPLRWLERNPTHNVLVTGYNQRFASKFGRRTLNMAKERGLISARCKAAADEWETTGGGLYMARGVGSPPTGTGFDLICVDDPIRRREDADSERYREKVWDWYTDDLYTRLEPNGAIVLIMTLWHEDDIGARMIASELDRWTVLKLPAFAEENDPLGRAPGAALWPERYNEEQLQRVHDVIVQNDGERSWQALYQQNPTPRKGTIFKADMLCDQNEQFWPWPHSEKVIEAYLSFDTAVKANIKNDMTAGCLSFRCSDGYVYLYPTVLDRMEIPQVIKTVALEWARWRDKLGPVLAVARIEEGAAGTPAVQGARQLMTQHRENPTPRHYEIDAIARQKPHQQRSEEERYAMGIVRASYPPNDDWEPDEWEIVRHASPLILNPYACGGSGDIVERVQPILPFVTGCNVRLCADNGNRTIAHAWLQQLLGLPTAKHDDAVQSTIGAVLPFVGAPAYKHGEEPCITDEMLHRVQRSHRQ